LTRCLSAVAELLVLSFVWGLTFYAELQILEAKTWELRLKKVNGTFVDLTLHCVGKLKSNPQWKHNDVIVSNGTLNTTLYRDMNQTTRHYTLTMTRRHVTERFAGRYQCVDMAFFQSDSDVLTIHARASVSYPGRLYIVGDALLLVCNTNIAITSGKFHLARSAVGRSVTCLIFAALCVSNIIIGCRPAHALLSLLY